MVMPPSSILAEPTVSLVDKNVDKHGTRAAAEAYLQVPLFRSRARRSAPRTTIARRARPSCAKTRRLSPSSSSSRSTQVAGDWKKAQKTHFDDGGVFDQIYQPSNVDRRRATRTS